MDRTRLSIDSLGESELDRIRSELKNEKRSTVEKDEIISSLRQQVTDLKDELEEYENNIQIMNQKLDRKQKELEEKQELIETITHAREEIEAACDKLNERCQAKSKQVQDIFDDLKKAKKELEQVKVSNDELIRRNERLTVDLEAAKHRKKLWQADDEEGTRRIRTPSKPSKEELSHALHFPIAEEVGEIMTVNSFRPELEPPRFLPKPEPLPKLEPEPVRQLELEPEPEPDPIAEYKMRVARANELARRNKLTKPLLQTSYALELDTFDTTNITENEIKRGKVVTQQRPPVLSTKSRQHSQQSRYQQQNQHSQQPYQRQPLVDRINTTPKARRVYKKAEAFIVE